MGHDHCNSLFTPRNYTFGATDGVIKRIVIKYINNVQEDVHIRTSRLKLTVSLHSNLMDLREILLFVLEREILLFVLERAILLFVLEREILPFVLDGVIAS